MFILRTKRSTPGVLSPVKKVFLEIQAPKWVEKSKTTAHYQREVNRLNGTTDWMVPRKTPTAPTFSQHGEVRHGHARLLSAVVHDRPQGPDQGAGQIGRYCTGRGGSSGNALFPMQVAVLELAG